MLRPFACWVLEKAFDSNVESLFWFHSRLGCWHPFLFKPIRAWINPSGKGQAMVCLVSWKVLPMQSLWPQDNTMATPDWLVNTCLIPVCVQKNDEKASENCCCLLLNWNEAHLLEQPAVFQSGFPWKCLFQYYIVHIIPRHHDYFRIRATSSTTPSRQLKLHSTNNRIKPAVQSMKQAKVTTLWRYWRFYVCKPEMIQISL